MKPIGQRAGVEKYTRRACRGQENLVDKTKLLIETSTENENLKRKVEESNQSLKDTKLLLWDHMLKEIKKLKDHLIMLQDEKTLVATCLSNIAVVQENMSDNPIQAQKEIKFLNS